MSFEATAWAWTIPHIKPGPRLLLLALANYADENGRAWPSTNTLSRLLNMKRDTIIKHARQLEADNHLSIETRTRDDGSRTSNRYHLKIGQGSPPKGTGVVPQGGQGVVPQGGQHEPVIKNQSKETIEARDKTPKKKKPAFDPSQVELPPNVPPDSWRAWVKHRTEIRRPLTPQAAAVAITQLTQAGTRAEELIELGIMNRWTGLKASWLRNDKPHARRDRPAWDVSGGDRQNRDHPDYRPVRGQTRNPDALTNDARNKLLAQARALEEAT